MQNMITRLYYQLTPTWKIHKHLLDTQYLSKAELEDLQLEKLKKLVDFANTTSSFWQRRFAEAHFEVSDLSVLADIQRLPILEKEDLRRLIKEDDTDTEKLVRRVSGGTTGEPTVIYTSSDYTHWNRAAMLRFYSWIGYRSGAGRAAIFAAPSEGGQIRNTLSNKIRNFLNNTLLFNPLEVDIQDIIREIRRAKPPLIMGYTSYLTILGEALMEEGRTLEIPDLKIVNAAEPLSDYTRAFIEKSLGGLVYNHYGSRDVGYIADECALRQGLHVHMEYLIVEIVDEDGQWVGDGEQGDILITQLENTGTPIIRYRIGDRAVRTVAICDCGKGLQLIPNVVGRSVDTILLPGGRKISGLTFPHIFKDFPILQYQLVQKSVDFVEVKIVLASEANASTLDRVRSALGELLPGMRVEVVAVEHIERSASGKLRAVISEVI